MAREEDEESLAALMSADPQLRDPRTRTPAIVLLTAWALGSAVGIVATWAVMLWLFNWLFPGPWDIVMWFFEP